MPRPVIARWNYRAAGASDALIFPDGCRDVIRYEDPDCGVHWFVTDIDDSARRVSLGKGANLIGWRLQPGASVCRNSVRNLPVSPNIVDGAAVSRCCTLSNEAEELLLALRESRSLAQACRRAGLSRRTMQRTTSQVTTKSPRFWMQLARVRRAGHALKTDASISEIAFAMGFSDQAHMTREMRRWLSLTPRGLRRDADLLAVLSGPGFD